MSELSQYLHYWPYGVAVLAGAALSVIDRRMFGKYVLGALLVLIVAGGQLGMYLSPFTFQGGDYYMESLIASLFALAGLAGYAVTVVTRCACTKMGKGA